MPNMKVLLNKILKKTINFLYLIYVKKFKKYFILSSSPLISGDSFKKIAQHKLDEANKFNPFKVSKSDIVFVKTDYLKEFVNEYLAKLPDDIILITHNSDINVKKLDFEAFKNRKIHWFVQNLDFNQNISPFINFLPIGFENRNWFKNGKLKNLLNQNIPINKIDKVFIGFNTNTNIERINTLSALKNNQNTFIFPKSSHAEYMSKLSNYKMSLCPQGNGIDTHRVWESLLVKTIPIVKRSSFSDNLETMSVPVFVLDDWEDLSKISSDEINKIYQENIDKLENIKLLNLKFWVEKFEELKIKLK